MDNEISFSTALDCLKNGEKISRIGWNGVGLHLELQTPDEHSKMSLPYIYMCILKKESYDKRNTPGETFVDADYDRVPWVVSHTDMLSKDWILV